MTRSAVCAIIVGLSVLPLQAQQARETPVQALKKAPEAIRSISAKDLRTHLEELASDDYEGRLTGTPGQQKAARYIAALFEQWGLEPLGNEVDGKRDWFHTYPVTLRKVDASAGLSGPEKRNLHKRSAWYIPASWNDGTRELDIVGRLDFLGRLSRREVRKRKLDATIPVIIADQSTARDGTLDINQAVVLGMSKTFGELRSAAKTLQGSQARAAVVLTREYNLAFQTTLGMLGLCPGRPSVILGPGAKDDEPFSMGAMSPRIPLLVLAGDDMRALLKALDLTEEEAFRLTTNVQRQSREKFALRFSVDREQVDAANVVGVIRGSDPSLSKEALIYSAHMDHVGLSPTGAAFNGADDNGSGTATLLELAQAYARLSNKERPRRSIIFLSVSGEELGLWGSQEFVRNPSWPLDDVIADINIDMIGRSTRKVPENAISLTPTFSHRKFSTLALEAAFLGKALDLEMRNGDRFYRRSDHYNFARKGIPVVFFCDDEHEDYHMPSDTADKIEYDKMERVARLAFLLGLRTADREERPRTIGRREDWEGNKR